MIDKNSNGIDDRKEGYRNPSRGYNPGPNFKEAGNFWDKVFKNWGTAIGAGLNPPGSNPPKTKNKPKPTPTPPPAPVGPAQMSFLDALQQAMSMTGGLDGGPSIPHISFDPQRETLRNNAGEADARLGAMYRQLQDSIAADSPKIQQAYQTAIDNTNAGAQQAQQAVQGASDAASARNSSVLANLGIGDAAQQIIAQGRDANTATAGTMQDIAAAGAADASNLTQNQTSSVQQNRSIGSAAGLEGNLQRAQNQAKLQALLAQIDMQEQEKNAAIDAQNAQSGSNSFTAAMDLADKLYSSNQGELDRNDRNAIKSAELGLKQRPKGPTFEQFLKQLGIGTADLTKDPKTVLDLAKQFNVQFQ